MKYFVLFILQQTFNTTLKIKSKKIYTKGKLKKLHWV